MIRFIKFFETLSTNITNIKYIIEKLNENLNI